MKNAFSNALLCGVLASTFIMVNCQKPPDRGVKANISPNARAAAQPRTAICDEASLAALNARKAVLDRAWERVRASTPPLDEPSKQELQNLAEELNTTTNAAVQAIQALRVGEEAADSCKVVDEANNNRVTATYLISDLQSANRQLGSAISDLTGASNPLLEQTPPAGEPPQGETPAGAVSDDITIAANSEMLIAKEELATILKDARSAMGDSFIVNAAVHGGVNNYNQALQNNNLTVCKVNVAVENAAIDSEIKIVNLEEKTENSRAVLDVNIQVGDQVSALSCVIAESARSAAPQAVRTALGDLVKKKEPVAEDPADQSSGDQSPVAPPADQASGDATPVEPPADQASGDDSSADDASGDDTAADDASGDASAASGDESAADEAARSAVSGDDTSAPARS